MHPNFTPLLNFTIFLVQPSLYQENCNFGYGPGVSFLCPRSLILICAPNCQNPQRMSSINHHIITNDTINPTLQHLWCEHTTAASMPHFCTLLQLLRCHTSAFWFPFKISLVQRHSHLTKSSNNAFVSSASQHPPQPLSTHHCNTDFACCNNGHNHDSQVLSLQ